MNVAALPSPCLSHFSILIVPESNSIHHQRITSRRVRLRPHLEVIRLILLHVHAVMQIRSGSSEVGAESAVSPVRMERGKSWNQGCGTVPNLNRHRPGAGSDEGIVIGVLGVHDVGLYLLPDADRVRGENAVV